MSDNNQNETPRNPDAGDMTGGAGNERQGDAGWRNNRRRPNDQKRPRPHRENAERDNNPRNAGEDPSVHTRPNHYITPAPGKSGNAPAPGNAQPQRRQGKPNGGWNANRGGKTGTDAEPSDGNRNAGNNGNNRSNGNNGNNGNRNGNRNGKGYGGNRDRNRDNRNSHHYPERRLYDPYEAPDKQEIELSELRARIVIKSADGTQPVAYGASSVVPASAPAERTVSAFAQSGQDAEENSGAPDDVLTPAPETPSPVDENAPKVEVVGIRFRSAGKTYYFDPHGIRAKKGDFAIVETTRGPEFGDVYLGNTLVNATDTVSPLRPLIRLATPADIAINAENREKEKHALVVCKEKILAHKLEMKLIDVQYAFDRSKLLFYFSAEGRVDFRELVKDLASVFRTRIELRQIGIRDEAKMLGGIGACGRPLCCSTFLPDFAQVSIKMAKEQNLSLNSSKISGVCGRLMCCLHYEADTYAEEIRKTPSNDSLVRTEDGIGTVVSSNPLAGTVRVALKDSPDAPKQYNRDAVTVLKDRRGESKEAKAEKQEKQ